MKLFQTMLVILSVSLIGLPINTEAQVLKKLKDKVKARTDQKTDTKANQEIDNSLDSILNGKSPLPKKEKTSQEDPANPAGGQPTPEPGQDLQLTAYTSKFDFVPGERVLYYEDFATDQVGDFPAKWNTNGSGEVVTIDGREGHWFMLKASSNFVFNDFLKLPDDFTLQFDLLCTVPYSWNSGSVYFGIAAVTNPDNYLNTSSHTLNSNDNRAFWIDVRPGDAKKHAKGYGHYLFYNTAETKMAGQNLDIPWFEDTPDQYLLHFSVWKQHQRLRIYLNENKIIDLPKILPNEMKVNAFVWKTGTQTDADRYFIGNVRIAAGNPDTRNKLLTDGKLVTSGILFNVNSDKIKEESYGVLKEIAGILKENESIRVQIVGHTDSDGDETANLDLSKRRAAAVKDALASTFGIAADRMETDGKGESEPAVPNTSAENKANNRRVEFIKIN